MKNDHVKRRILVFGAGVIGSTFGGLLAESGHDVTLLARNNRFRELNNAGLLLKGNNNPEPRNIPVHVISTLEPDDVYDYILVTLRKEQVQDVLSVLSLNKSPRIVFMVNNPSGYDEWTSALGYGRVIPAFPGAGGKIENGIVHYQIVSGFIQPTTIGEIDGRKSGRIKELKQILEGARLTVAVSGNMDAWQKTHVAMVGPLGDVIYYDGGNNYTVARNMKAINQMNLSLKENFHFLKASGIGIEPRKLKIITLIPRWILNLVMRYAFDTKWAETVICNHALNARGEMEVMSNEFIQLAQSKGYELKEFKKLVGQ